MLGCPAQVRPPARFAFEDASFLGRIQRFGMRTASFSQSPAYWGYMCGSPQDLDNLMNYIVNKLPARNRDYIVDHLRRVATIQQWGVWGAGRADKPGNKDGWEDDDDVWITNTVGFAGPHERYTLRSCTSSAAEKPSTKARTR